MRRAIARMPRSNEKEKNARNNKRLRNCAGRINISID